MKKYLLLLLAAATFTSAKAQTGISAAGTAPRCSSHDGVATDKGFMVTRVALTALENNVENKTNC